MNTRVVYGFGLFALLSLAGCAADQKAAETGSAPAKGSVAYDHDVFSKLLDKHDSIRRTWREIDGGIESVTESDDPAIAALIIDHAEAMKVRVEAGNRIRQWDPIFVAVFDAAAQGKLKMMVERTAKGVRVQETSSDPKVTAVIRSHAGVVSAFVHNGFPESSKPHPVP